MVSRRHPGGAHGLARTAQPLGDRVLATAASVAAGVGRELTIEIEVARRLRAAEQQRQQLQHLARHHRGQTEVLNRLAVGHTNQEIAEELSIMSTTVKTYLKNIMHKLGTRNRVETIHAARRAGLLA